MKHIRVAKRYATALFKTARQENALENVHNDAHIVIDTIASARDFKAVLRSPVIQSWKKKNLLVEVFEGKVSVLTLTFLGILCSKNREDITSEIFEQFFVLYNEHSHLVPIQVTSAVALDENAKRAIEASISTRFNKKALASYEIDPTLKGGLMIQVGDTLLDSSLRTQLQKMRTTLLNDPTFLN